MLIIGRGAHGYTATEALNKKNSIVESP